MFQVGQPPGVCLAEATYKTRRAPNPNYLFSPLVTFLRKIKISSWRLLCVKQKYHSNGDGCGYSVVRSLLTLAASCSRLGKTLVAQLYQKHLAHGPEAKTSKECSDTGTRTRVSCVKGKYANHLHHIGLLFMPTSRFTVNVNGQLHHYAVHAALCSSRFGKLPRTVALFPTYIPI
jgi:hypothetical protein